MKKIYILTGCMLMLFSAYIVAQDKHAIQRFPQQANREFEFQCPLNSVFSQGYPDLAVGIVIQEQEVADDFLASEPFNSIRFWETSFDMTTFTGCSTSIMTFDIRFYNRNLSDPTIPGSEFASYTLTTTMSLLEVVPGYWLAMADINFPSTISLTDGWVSITRVQDSDPCWAFLWGSDFGGNACVHSNGEWVYGMEFWGTDFAPDLCFYTANDVQDVPVSNWAIVAGLLLIGTFIVIRFRRII